MPVKDNERITITCTDCRYARDMERAVNTAHDWAIKHSQRNGHTVQVRSTTTEVLHTYQPQSESLWDWTSDGAGVD